ncbi:MAG: ABC transporter ATP-binding protein [Actinobacteria bacterium]|jgi:NitT/TauT family transport system ATP-binding protein|nr:ABC transporter ATP-binding protein [Actinomycetota bacterium]MBT3688122.1 ABC transporter ATP-binding protein [Actinomycetota bacterium]MBT4037703.1 ABC transporter ATP-binding protein [Actinomycetota bacterium]MBT4278117.1 ABC transporter ATP-binding protein [Actinomycetota bacterium]MBT4342563.1 ABC transporter ATP-binding protein [Actinomycetota bacterium]
MSSGGEVPAVVVDGVGMVFNEGTGGEVAALDGIDLTIRAGEFVTLIGPSGCGKSTLLRLIGDLLTPTAGGVSVFDKSAHESRTGQDYGMVFQHAGLFDWRKVKANIELPLELRDWSKTDRNARSAEMLDLVKLDEFGDHYPRQLSGGMQQRVSIARALSFEPRLLLMDEPFGALDEMTREHMQGELLRIWGETGTTVVFVTHSISEAAFLSNRVIVLSPRPGRVHSIIDVDLGERTPDTREDPDFFAAATTIREALRSVGGAE